MGSASSSWEVSPASTVRPPTIREVARMAGVSPMTVSRVLNGRGYVANETAARVRAASGELRYRPNSVARLLRGRRSGLVGVTIPSLTSSVHRGIVSGLEEVLVPAGYQLVLGHLQSGARPYSSFLQSVQQQHCDGYVIVPSRVDADTNHAREVRPDRPTVAALSSVPGITGDRVLTEGSHEARSATELLLTRFGGPVAFVGVDSRLSHDVSLLDGYRQAMVAAGEDERVLLIRVGADDCRTGVRAMLAAPNPPRAFVLASSLVVFEALGELVQAGRTLGEDVGVVAVASEERPWTALLPFGPILLIIPARDIGRQAGELLLQRLRGEAPRAPETITLSIQLIDERPLAAAGRTGDGTRRRAVAGDP